MGRPARYKGPNTLTRLERQKARHWIDEGLSDCDVADKIGVSENAVKRYRTHIQSECANGTSMTTTPLARRVWLLSIKPHLTPQQERFMAIYISEMAAVTRRKFSEADHLVRTTGLDANTAAKLRQVQAPIVDRKEIFGAAVSCAALSADDSA